MDAVGHGERGEDELPVRAPGPDEFEQVLAFIATSQAERGGPVLDEAERQRLEAAATDGEVDDWLALVVVDDGTIRGYAGGDLGAADLAEFDLVVPLAADRSPAYAHRLVTGLRELVAAHGREGLRLWRRVATDDEVHRTASLGLEEDARLLVLGRALDPPLSEPDPPGGITVRMYEPDEDDERVVEVLSEAYEGEVHWDLGEFRRRRAMPWFDPDDLFVAEGRNGDIAGIHWMKRRAGSLGEVYNLAIRPYAQGLGLGRALLCEGLAYLARVGCEEVILWVDASNQPAVDLYRSEGFQQRWADVAFVDQR